jgi:protein O-GlcNAc transferase
MSMLAPLTDIFDALRRGETQLARTRGQALVIQTPGCASAHHALGLTFCADGDFAQALPHFDRAHQLEPGEARYARACGIAHTQLAQWPEALAVLRPVLGALDTPTRLLFLTAAIEAGEAAAALRDVERWGLPGIDGELSMLCEYARVLTAASRTAEAEDVLNACLARDPALARAHEMLGQLCEQANRGDESLEHWQAFAQARPSTGYARIRLAMAYSARGMLDEARGARLEAMRLGLDAWDQRSTALYLMLYDDAEDASAIRAAYEAAFVDLKADVKPGDVKADMNAAIESDVRRGARVRGSRLRIGYLSGEFRPSPAFYFLTPFLAHHDRASVEVFLYHNSRTNDACTTAYHGMAEHWRDVSRLTDDEVIAAIDRDGIDVLVDLSGHFPEHRLSVFARRAAPAQATFPNYPSTTGCAAIDYFFTDRWTSPEGSEAEYTERLHHLSCGYLMYAPPPEAPEPSPSIAGATGAVTFGVFQRLAKIGPSAWDAFAEVLRRVPRSRLLLHNGDAALDHPDSVTVKFLLAQFATRDIPPDRVTLIGGRGQRAHMEAIGQADIALDTWPYSGHTTTCECLWMGVPVVTRRRSTHVSRVSSGLLLRAGLSEGVADSFEEYVNAAVRLAGDIDGLVHARATLRARAIDAGLTNGPRLAREMEAAYWAFSR